MIGPTGRGKTYLAYDLLQARKYVLALITKKKDQTIDRYEDYRAIDAWHKRFYDDTRLLLWKRAKTLGDTREQRETIFKALSDVYASGGWALYLDDLFYLSETLHMRRALQMMYTQVRSDHITLVASIQRPFWVPVEVTTQATHVIIFKSQGDIDMLQLAKAAGVKHKELEAMNSQLDQWDFIYVKHGLQATVVRKEG